MSACIDETAIEHTAASTEITSLIADLVQIAGVSVTAIVGGGKTEHVVHDWMTGETKPANEGALRFAYRLALMIRHLG